MDVNAHVIFEEIRITIPILCDTPVEKPKVNKKCNQYSQSICPSFSPLSYLSHQDNLDVTSAYLDPNTSPRLLQCYPCSA